MERPSTSSPITSGSVATGVTDADIEGLMAETAGDQHPWSRLLPWRSLAGARDGARPGMSDATFAEIKQHLSNEHDRPGAHHRHYCAVVRVLATMKIDNGPTTREVLQQYPIPGVK